MSRGDAVVSGPVRDRLLAQAVRLQRQGDAAAAVIACRTVLRGAPGDVDAWQLLAWIEVQRGNIAAGLEAFEKVAAARPRDAAAHTNVGNALLEVQRSEDALRSYDRALALDPVHTRTLYNRGVCLGGLGRHAEALASYERALAIEPRHVDALYGRGNALASLGRHGDAAIAFERALAVDSGRADIWINRGNSLQELCRLDEALACYARARVLEPNSQDAAFHEALLRLLAGDYERGWPLYEARWRTAATSRVRRDLPGSQWRGEKSDLRDKTVLLHAEQGFGDTIQFCRYAPLVAQAGATVILEVQPALQTLMRSLAGVETVIARGGSLPRFDLHCPLLSLPLAFGTTVSTIPSVVPYLRAPADRVAQWQERLHGVSRPRIGVAWAGSGAFENDQRSIALATLTTALPVGPAYVSLQKDVRDSDGAALLARPDIADFRTGLTDFADTAALVELLDLVVTVDTAVAHLAAAMGKPVLLLAAYNPTWRWLLGRGDSPWYPTVRLLRQTAIGDWSAGLSVVREAISAGLPFAQKN